ncbi:MAG: hypothetical protein RLY16_895 [Bacteroidota bacterium]
MRKIFTIVLLICLLPNLAKTQSTKPIVSGPWVGNVQLRNATVWVEVTKDVKSVAVKYAPITSPSKTTLVTYKGELGKDFNPLKIALNGLMFNTTYAYKIIVDGKEITTTYPTQFTTYDLWQWRKPAPDFSFLTGSCAYFNEPIFDRPGKPYGGDSSIFDVMAQSSAQFNIWLGDNWYTREVDYSTAWGLNYRASHDRATPVLQKFMASMPQYAIWDDHDFGPNDQGKSYLLKDESRKVFMDYTCNSAYGEDGKGIYSTLSYGDVDIFLTDDRYFRSEPALADTINGQVNTDKTFFGKAQLAWLKESLLFSHATFKIIATGSQVLNSLNKFECMQLYPYEYQDLMNFLALHNISGVLFITGDRHHSEIISLDRPGLYPLYDITTSPLTAGVSKVRGAELNHPNRVPGTLFEEQNFSKFSISGPKNQRVLTVDFIGLKGNKLGSWSIAESKLKRTPTATAN